MNMKDELRGYSLIKSLELANVKFSRERLPSNPAQQVKDVLYEVRTASDMAKALATKTK